MNETQTEIVVSGSPYRETPIVPLERKLSKEEAKTLIDIVKEESYSVGTLIYGYDGREVIWPIFGFKVLESLGYTGYGEGIYAKGATFYRVKEDVSEDVTSDKISIISGKFYGNLAEIIANFKKFEGIASYAREKLGFIEAMSIFPLLGLPLFKRSLELHKRARDLPKDFASYKYGKDAVEQLRKEYADRQPKDTAKVQLPLNSLGLYHKKRGKKGLNPKDIPKYSNIIEPFSKKYTK